MQVANVMQEGAEMRLSEAILIYSRKPAARVEPPDLDYEEEAEEPADHLTIDAFASIHSVNYLEDVKPVIGPGTCLTRESLENLVRSLRNERSSTRSILPPEVLCLDGGLLAWYRPSRIAPIYFKSRDDKFNGQLNNKRVIHPALLFIAAPHDLYCYALASSDRPTNDSPVYVAPYYNFYDSGRMCQGNAKYPDSLSLDVIPDWERAFFDTQFTHSNYSTWTITSHPDGHFGLWKLCRERAKSEKSEALFPVEYLSPLKEKQTVRDVINHVGKGR